MQLKTLWLGIGYGLIVLVIVASLMPNPPHTGAFEQSDKLAHFGAYAFTMLWFAQIYTRNRTRWVIALALVMLGIALEWLQGLTGYRTFEYADMVAGAAGVLCAQLLARTRLSRILAVVDRSLVRLRKRIRAHDT